MRKKIEWQWEKLDAYTKRVKVIGGWLVHHGWDNHKNSCSETMQFVSDRDHEWHIVPPMVETVAVPAVDKSSDFEPKAK